MQAVKDALRYCLERGLTFVAFRGTAGPQLWIQREAGLTECSLAELGTGKDKFVVAPFATGSQKAFVLLPQLRVQLDKDPFPKEKAQECIGSIAQPSPESLEGSEEEHRRIIHAAQGLMSEDKLRKVVLSRSIPKHFPKASLPELFTSALTAYPQAFVCLLSCPEQGTWLGASPERLLHWHDGSVTVDSIAATLPAESAPPHAEDWGAKERDEQELVSQAVAQNMAICPTSMVERSATKVISAGPVAHLHTVFTAAIEQQELWRLSNALHPTPAVCGTPREQAMDFILKHESQERKLYAGYWGPWSMDGDVELYVNIRCMEVHDDAVRIHVGGGITAGSIAQNEWQELEYKASTWTKLMEAQQGPIS